MLLTLTPLTADATSSTSITPSSPVFTTAAMTVIGIDNEIAAKAGNRVAIVAGYKVLYNGATGAELARIPLSGITYPGTRTISPMGVVTGNCGTSYLYL